MKGSGGELNLPNKLTILRILLVPVFLLVVLADFSHSFLLAAFVFSVAAITDAVDGKLARKNNQITVFGKLVDPIADKLLTTSAFLAFMELKICSIWIVMIVLAREFTITSARMIASSQGIVVPANIWGKVKTASQMVSIIAILLLCELDASLSLNLPLVIISNCLLGFTALLTVVSGVVYIIDISKKVKFFQ